MSTEPTLSQLFAELQRMNANLEALIGLMMANRGIASIEPLEVLEEQQPLAQAAQDAVASNPVNATANGAAGHQMPATPSAPPRRGPGRPRKTAATPPPTETVKVITYDDIREAVTVAYKVQENGERLVSLLEKYGCASFRDLPADKYSSFLTEVQALPRA